MEHVEVFETPAGLHPVSAQLKDLLTKHLYNNPHISVDQLSRLSGVGMMTLERIIKGQVVGAPAPHTILNILSALSGEATLAELVTNAEGPLGELLKETYGPFLEFNLKHKRMTGLNKELQDSITYFIYKVGANRAGVSWEWVDQTFGKLGTDRLLELMKKDLLIEVEGRYHACQKDFALDIGVASFHLPQMVKFYKPHELDRGLNLFYTLSESLNEEAIQKIKSIEKKALQEIYNIMNDESSAGSIPYFSLLMSDELSLKQREALQ